MADLIQPIAIISDARQVAQATTAYSRGRKPTER